MLPELKIRLENMRKFVDGAQGMIDAMTMLTLRGDDEDWTDDTEKYFEYYDNALEIYYEDEIIKNCDDREKVLKHVEEVLDGYENSTLTPPENYNCLRWEYENILTLVRMARIGARES